MVSRHLILKFYLWFLLAWTLTVFAASGAFYLLSGTGWEGHYEESSAARASAVRRMAENFLAKGVNPQELTGLMAPLFGNFSTSLAILSQQGVPLAVSRLAGLPPDQPPLPDGEELGKILNNPVRVRHFWWPGPRRIEITLPIHLAGGEPGIFVANIYPFLHRRERFPLRLLGGLGVVLVVGWLLCWPLAARLARPLKQMAAAADDLGKGRLDTRINLKRRDEIGRLAERFNAMAGNLQALVGAHKQLLADISHELRSPLARQRVALELARQESTPGAEQYLAQVERQAEALDTLIGELLTHSRLDTMPYGLRTEPLQAETLVREELAAQANEAAEHRVSIDFQNQAGTSEILVDRLLLRRALANGLKNGIAHAPPDSPLRVTLVREGETLAIRIADEGPGVPPEMLEQIFQPFFKVDSARSKEKGGFGLGLAITRRAMEAHGGGANAEPGPGGKGFVLTLWLPQQPFPIA